MKLTVHQGNNLETLRQLKEAGDKFDLVELDGPYMAGLEDWDNMTEAEYIAHYAERLSLVRDILQPWGVVFVFGYPEGCAEIKSWARRTETLYLRRWLHWYKQRTAHKGRKVEIVMLFWRDNPTETAEPFGRFLRQERERRGMTLRDIGNLAERQWWHRGGNLYYENGNGGHPSLDDLFKLSTIFNFCIEDWPGTFWENYEGLTDLDYLDKTYPEETAELNDNGLRSKPIGLYLDLFRPTIPPTEEKKALILYGGSGNAGIAAASLGYDVTICEQSPERCKAIEERWARDVAKWTQRANNRQKALPLIMPEQAVLL